MDDLAKNIFDLSANMHDNTQEGYSTQQRTKRGSAPLPPSDDYYYGTEARQVLWGYPTRATSVSRKNGTTTNVAAPYIGSRMTLYIKNQENQENIEQEKPTIQSIDITEGTNNIKVLVKAIDKNYGISKYNYYLLDENKNEIQRLVGSYSFTHTFFGLEEETKYYVKVEVVNLKGRIKESEDIEATTEEIVLKSSDITLEKTWGKDGDGRAYFKLADEYVNGGYYLQHVIVRDVADYIGNEDYYWNPANKQIIDKNNIKNKVNNNLNKEVLTGLKNGDIVFTRIYDGNNAKSAGIQTMVVQISHLEEYKYLAENGTLVAEEDVGSRQDTSKTKNVLYTDSNGDKAMIPAGFKVGSTSLVNTIKNGLVIEDSDENQFVWIPVENAIYDPKSGKTISTAQNYTPMAILQSEGSSYYEGIRYTYNATTNVGTRATGNGTSLSTSFGLGTLGYREPSLVTGASNYTWSYESGTSYDGDPSNYNTILNVLGITKPEQLGSYMNNEYTSMINSVATYKGFYLGRYETTAKDDAHKTTNNTTHYNMARTKLGYIPMARNSATKWYTQFLLQDSNFSGNAFYGNSRIKTSMIFASQYQAALNFILKGPDKDAVTTIRGNHTGTCSVTGLFGDDLANNIFDLASNRFECSQEAYSLDRRVVFGGTYTTTSGSYARTTYTDYTTLSTTAYIGSRMAMYIK